MRKVAPVAANDHGWSTCRYLGWFVSTWVWFVMTAMVVVVT